MGVFTLVAAGCGTGAGSGGKGVPAGYFTATGTEPEHPLQPANEPGGSQALAMLFRGLYTYDSKTGALVPAMARSFETKDNVTWTATIKPGWKFSNGEPVTATSYVDAWNWSANSKNLQANAVTWFQDIEGFKDVHPSQGDPIASTMSGLHVVDDTTFTVKLTRPVSSFKARMGYAPYSPLPSVFFSDPAKYGQSPIGNGPFMMDEANGGWTHKQSITLKRNDSYSGDDKARAAGVRLVIYTTYDAAYTALRSDKLDVIDQIPPTAVGDFRKDLGNRAIVMPQLGILKLGFPLYDANWNTPGAAKVRRGISMAIDRAGITKALNRGMEQPAIDWLAPGVPGHTDTCGDVCRYDPVRAKQLVAEGGGIPGGTFTIAANADGPNHDWVTAVCNSINQSLGAIVCEPKLFPESSTFRNQVTSKRMTGAFRNTWKADYPYPDNFLNDVYRTGAASNDAGYSSPEFERLADQAQADTDEKAALKAWQDAERQLARDLPDTPLWYYTIKAGFSTHVSNVSFDEFGSPVWTEITVN